MAQFKIELKITKSGLRGDKVKDVLSSKILPALIEQLGDVHISKEFKKVNLTPSRAERLAEANDLKITAFDIVTGLADEMDEWFNNLPENLQSSDKASQIEETRDNLQQAADDLENVDLESIEFPGAF